MKTETLEQLGNRENKPDRYGFISSFENCTFAYGEHNSTLTIKPKDGQKVGCNMGRLIYASPRLLRAVIAAEELISGIWADQGLGNDEMVVLKELRDSMVDVRTW